MSTLVAAAEDKACPSTALMEVTTGWGRRPRIAATAAAAAVPLAFVMAVAWVELEFASVGMWTAVAAGKAGGGGTAVASGVKLSCGVTRSE